MYVKFFRVRKCFLRDLKTFHFVFKITISKMRNLCSRFRSSHQRCSMKKGVFRIFSKFTGKYPCQNLFFNKVTGLRSATLLKKRFWDRCFPVNFVKLLRIPFLQNTSGRLLLQVAHSLKFAHLAEQVVNKHCCSSQWNSV